MEVEIDFAASLETDSIFRKLGVHVMRFPRFHRIPNKQRPKKSYRDYAKKIRKKMMKKTI